MKRLSSKQYGLRKLKSKTFEEVIQTYMKNRTADETDNSNDGDESDQKPPLFCYLK